MLGLGFGDELLIDLVTASPGGFGKINAVGTVSLQSFFQLRLQLVAAPGFTAPIGTVFEIVTNDGTDAVTGTFAGLPQGRSLPAGARNMVNSYTGGTGNDITLTVAQTLDIDGDSKYLAETDGLLIARYLKGLTGPALTQGAVAISAGAKRTSDTDIFNYLNSLGNVLNVDQIGSVGDNDALLIMRWMFGVRGAALVAGLPLPPGLNAVQYADTVRNLMEPLTP